MEVNSNIKKNNVVLILKKVIIILLIFFILSGIVYIFLEKKVKFRDLTIEVGTSNINIDDFLINTIYKKNSSILSNINAINLNTVGNYNIQLKYKKKIQSVKLAIVDTIPPKVEFKDVNEYTGYEINPKDFIVSIEDYSDYNVTYVTDQKINNKKYTDYDVKIIVTDIYGNETSKVCKLTLGWLIPSVTIEAGEENLIEKLVANVAADANKIPKSVLNKIDVYTVGDYHIDVKYEGIVYTSDIKVIDTTPPELKLRNVTIYENATLDKDAFIRSVTDNSNKVTTNLKTTLKFGEYGSQKVLIEAIDSSGNVTTKETRLVIERDTTPPTITGLTDIMINKNERIDYNYGVSAYDEVDGSVNFSVDSSSVNVNTAGTYYVSYSAKDNRGNINSLRRIVVVRHDYNDTNNLLNAYANSLGSDISSLVEAVRNDIRYSNSWGEDDPVWYGLSERRGNCYVHAMVLQGVLNSKGIQNQLITTLDKSHYWNLVNINGVWRHVDSTPGNNYVLLTDDVMETKLPVTKGGGWDKNAYPAAE